MSRDRATGLLQVARGRADGTFSTSLSTGTKAGAWTMMVPVGEVTQDAVADVLHRMPDGSLVLDARGSSRSSRAVGVGWGAMTAVTSAGPQSGVSGAPYLYGRTRTGDPWAYAGDGKGGFSGQVRVGGGWDGMVEIMGGVDVTADGVPDLIGRHRNGNLYLYLYRGLGKGLLAAAVQIGNGWDIFDSVSLVRSSGQNPSLVARSPDGRIRRYVFARFTPAFERIVDAGTGWQGQDLIW